MEDAVLTKLFELIEAVKVHDITLQNYLGMIRQLEQQLIELNQKIEKLSK